jgi:ATP-dependent helicase/nuclease subunit B
VRLHLSQSSIQTFALCPYRYYASHRLKLRGQKDSSIGAADEGNFLHFVFERFLKKCLSEEQTLSLPSLDELPALADEVIEEYLECVCPIPPEEMDHRLLHLLRRLRGLAVLILREIVGELSSGSFTPVGFEQRLGGSEKNSLPAVLLNLTDGCTVELHGTVDRVDVFEKDEKLYVRIVDYKTGEHKFSFDKVRTGEDLQLVLYLFAVVSSNPDRYVPCGAEFLYSSKENGRTTVSRSGFLLEEESIRHAADCSEAQGYLKGLSATSLDQIEKLTEEMKDVICEIAERILSGEAEKTPSPDACRFCDLKKHCDVACHEKK